MRSFRFNALLCCLVWVLLSVSVVVAQKAFYGHSQGYSLPDPVVTPGAVNPNAVADLTGASHIVNGLEMNLCAKSFRSTFIRKTIVNFPGLKKKACAEYSVANCDVSVEGDHLISIELGGCQDCLTNLWPQPMAEAKIKDHQVEDKLPGLVCSGKISLADAQRCLATDWVVCSQRIAAMK
jgi:hypothetical protein